MFQRPVIAVLCTAAVSVSVLPAHAAHWRGASVFACSRGVSLTLIVRRRVFPQDALVRVTLVVKNLRPGPITGPDREG